MNPSVWCLQWGLPSLVMVLLLAVTSRNSAMQGSNNITGNSRTGRFLNLFSVIRFSNTPCIGSVGRNGTCYTDKECRQRKGLGIGTCAGGFGVCCTFSVGCGQTTNENCSYLNTDLSDNVCQYTICKCNPDVTLIRLDFTEFNIAQPFTCGGSTSPTVCTTKDGPLIGDCIKDQFTVTSPGSPAPPVICGYNTGQHMYVPASDLCNKITFNMDLLHSGVMRMWEIKVTQYDETQDQRFLAPPGCLQWNTGIRGEVQNFNYKDTSSTHLSSQQYSICWRRERGFCAICFAVGYFGLSNVPQKVPSSSTGTTDWTRLAGMTDSICCSKDTDYANCETSGANDYIEITGASGPPVRDPFVVGDGNRFCGRWLGVTPAITPAPSFVYNAINAARTLCTIHVPFRLRVHFSDGEVLSSTAANVCATSRPTAGTGDTGDECSTFRLYGNRKGTLGFQLDWWQIACIRNPVAVTG